MRWRVDAVSDRAAAAERVQGREVRRSLGRAGAPSPEEATVADDQTLRSISALDEEEHELRRREGRGEASDADRARIQEIEVLLDQCWDLLRQRRARRGVGLDPEDAQVRSASTVEGYQQ